MSFKIVCAILCMLLSGWGVVQLFIMGFLFFFEAPTLLEEAEEHEYVSYEEFIKKTKSNYKQLAYNCWIACAVYLVTFALSYGCIISAKASAKRMAELMEDDEYVCNAPYPMVTREQEDKKVDDKRKKSGKN